MTTHYLPNPCNPKVSEWSHTNNPQEVDCPNCMRLNNIKKVFKPKQSLVQKMDEEGYLTDNQIENWRKVLSTSIGVMAFMLDKEEIQNIHDLYQKRISEETK
jgi:hypothetical protein